MRQQNPTSVPSIRPRPKKADAVPDIPNIVPGKERLTEKQRLFVTHLVHDRLNATASARLAGFADPGCTARELLRTPKVVAAIAEERAEYARASGMTKQKVLEGFSEAIDLARLKGDAIAMIAGWREISKLCGFYEPQVHKVEVSVKGKVLLERLNTMSDAELLQLAETDPSVLEGDFSVVDE